MPGKAFSHHPSAHHGRKHSPREPSAALDRILLRLVDVGLGVVIFLAPLFMGGRNDIGRLVYVAAVCATALVWIVRQIALREARWRWSGAEAILLAGLFLIVAQLVPLPLSLQQKLSPQIAELLPLWTSSGAGPVASSSSAAWGTGAGAGAGAWAATWTSSIASSSTLPSPPEQVPMARISPRRPAPAMPPMMA